MAELHIIEPTLADQAGHCYTYAQNLLQANADGTHELHFWFDRRGQTLFANAPCHVHPFFSRRWRKLQQWWCYRQLLRQHKNIFVPTAGRIDLVFLNQLLGRKKYEATIFLHFHQFKVTPEKAALLKRIAKRHPEFIIMAPTPALVKIFQDCGFVNCHHIPCPTYAPSVSRSSEAGQFNKVIFAGAARQDKGFPEVVDFIAYAAEHNLSLPIEMQISPPHSGRYDEASQNALARLKTIDYPMLTTHAHTLVPNEFQALFNNAICLLVYDPDSYRDKFSSVSLDAFYAGCPIVTVANTWSGDMAERFAAGVALTDRSPDMIAMAIKKICENYKQYHDNAVAAGAALLQEHDPKNTMRFITEVLS